MMSTSHAAAAAAAAASSSAAAAAKKSDDLLHKLAFVSDTEEDDSSDDDDNDDDDDDNDFVQVEDVAVKTQIEQALAKLEQQQRQNSIKITKTASIAAAALTAAASSSTRGDDEEDPILAAREEEKKEDDETMAASTAPQTPGIIGDDVESPAEDESAYTPAVEVTLAPEPVESKAAPKEDEAEDDEPQVEAQDDEVPEQEVPEQEVHEEEPLEEVEESPKEALESPKDEETATAASTEPAKEEEEDAAAVLESKSVEPTETEEVAPAPSEEEEEATSHMKVGEWAAFSQEIFLNSQFPAKWEMPTLVDQCVATDERLWKRYFDARCLLSKACEDPKEGTKLTQSHDYKRELEFAFEQEWKDTTLGSLLQKHTYQRATKVVRDVDTGVLEDATVVSTIFSPYFLPRAIQLCMRYHRLPNDFWVSWHIQFVSLKDHKEDKMSYWRPHLRDMWELCSNGYLKMPTNEVAFIPIQDIDTAYLTPNMVRKIRKWLFGSAKSTALVDDLTLMKYILGSCGAVRNFTLLKGDLGYMWDARENHVNDMKDYGDIPDEEIDVATNVGTNWLEFEMRKITGSLRSIDQWFDPYDVKYYKGIWGEKVMEMRYRKYGIYEQDEHIRNNPHKVWERAERKIQDKSLPTKVLKVVGSL